MCVSGLFLIKSAPPLAILTEQLERATAAARALETLETTLETVETAR